MKPSERIKEIHKALKILDGQDPNAPGFGDPTFFEQAIMDYLDEMVEGTSIEQRSGGRKGGWLFRKEEEKE